MVRLILILGLLTSFGCGRNVELDNNSPRVYDECKTLCKEKFNSELSYVGFFSGSCYCK
jgi:hypothetical protein